MAFENLPPFPTPEKVAVKDTEGDSRVPYERIKSYDDKEYELFIREWVVSLKDRYQVRGFGGAGDKGRDVVAKDSNNKYYYYQCKHYDHPLNPSDIYPELGKLIYYTFTKTIPSPCEYYILAPHDIGPKLNDLIDNPANINQKLLEIWDINCRSHIHVTPVEMSKKLKKYILNFDFSIIKTKTMLEIVSEHQKTAFYAFRFGGGLTVSRDRLKPIPETVQTGEMIYLKKILQAISEKENDTILSLEELAQRYNNYMVPIKRQRERFYSADNLRIFSKEHLMIDDYFEDLKNDIYYGIYDDFEKSFSNGYERMLQVLTDAAMIDLSHNLLVKYGLVHPKDKQGICHFLANEREDIIWTNKK